MRARGFVQLEAILVALAFAVGAGGGAWATRLHYLHRIDQEAAQRAEDAAAASEVERLRGRAYEAWKARQAPKTINHTRRLDHEIQVARPWADTPLPPGVRSTLEQAPGELGAAEPGGALPAVPGATPADK